MPPGDTIYIPGQTGPPPPIDLVVDSTLQQYYVQQTLDEKGPHYLLPVWQMFILVILLLSVLLFYYVYLPGWLKKRRIRNRTDNDLAVNSIQYDYWLKKYNPYYNSLSPEFRKRFLNRTVEFMDSKEFRFHYMEPEEQVLVLVSGAAVQLTFGLKRFLIEYFPVINVIKREYSVVGREKILEGHVQVNNQSINISWNNFIEDYTDYTDAENLGLHEMAHAISFDFLYGNHENRNAAFMARFKEYIQEARLVFKDLCQGRNDLLDDYGTLNVEEFWAVCIETFFENSEEFSRKMPDLYLAVADVLNQDPLKPDKIINKELAGLAN